MSIAVPCPSCGRANDFAEAYHAGFSELGFLYNEAGNLTLVWGVFDPAYVAVVGNHNPWCLSRKQERALEQALLPSPAGDRWLFANPARCTHCSAQIASPMSKQIYCYIYPGSVWTFESVRALNLAAQMRKASP